jgi:hypothetical protein
MKQGMGKTTIAGTKVEPVSQGIDPGAVSSIGLQQVRTTSRPMYEGRGLEAPMVGSTSHKSGTQGKY